MAEAPEADLSLAEIFPDLSIPTSQLHQEPDVEQQQFTEPFAQTRAELDHSYHGHYTVERQHIQNGLLSRCLEFGGRTVSAPWLIFTCGAMGVGKGHALRYLHSKGRFPRNHFCLVDPDRFRKGLPETASYIANQLWRTLGRHTQREAGYLSEIALAACLNQSRNCVYDSSLRDATFWSSSISRIRAKYPQYKLVSTQYSTGWFRPTNGNDSDGVVQAIYFVTAPHSIIFDRALKRARETGRYIPADVLQEAIHSAPAAFEKLKGMVDFTAVIDTGGATPKVVHPSPQLFADHRNMLTESRDVLMHQSGELEPRRSML